MLYTHIISALNHTLLTLQLDILLLLGIGQSPRDTDQESTGAQDPQRLAAEAQAGLGEGGDGGDGARERAARRRGDHVLQSRQAVQEGLAVEFVIGLVGDFGLWG